MKINVRPDCGNAPKRKLLEELTIAFASYRIDKVMPFMDDNVVWTLVGDKPIVGKTRFETALIEMQENKATELTIHHIVTHGKEAAINGEMTLTDGNTFGFSDFYEFTSAKGSKVKSITSYVVQIEESMHANNTRS